MRRDWWMCAAVLALAVFGMVVQVRMAGTVPDMAGFLPLVLGLGFGALAACAFNGERMARWLGGKGAWIAYGAALALMAALLAFGRRYRGGLYLPGRLNPSEIVKLCLVAFAAGWLGTGNVGFRRIAAMAAAVAGVAALVAAAGDLGLLAQLAVTVVAMTWVVSWSWGAMAAAAMAGGAWLAVLYPSGHLATRFAVWRDPFADVTGAGWQTLQGLTAVASGGLKGSGLGMGEVQSVPIVASDFVYAAVAEELGLLGCAVVLALWGLVFMRGLRAAQRHADDGNMVPTLLATGIVASLAVQTLLNVAGVLNVLPMTGITLPLISLGGSSLATTLLMCGILVGISRR